MSKWNVFFILKHRIQLLYQKGALHIITGNFVIKFITLCGSIFIVRLLPKEEYGVLGYIENMYSYIYIFAGLGLSAAAIRYIILKPTIDGKKSVFTFTVKTQTLFNITLIIAGALFFVLLYQHPIAYRKSVFLIPGLLLMIPFQDLIQTCLSTERAFFSNQAYVKAAVTIAAADVLFRTVGTALFGINGTVAFRVAANILSAGLLYVIVKRKYFDGIASDTLASNEKKGIVEYSIQNMLANGLWVLLTITDIFLIGRLCDNPELLADYKVAGIFPSNMAIVTAAIGMFLGPYFVSHETDYIWVKKNYLRALAGNAALVGMISVVLFLGASWIIRIVYGEDYTDAVGIMRILTVAFFISSSFKSLTANFLAIMGRVRQTLITSAIGFIIQVAMGIIVIPHFGIRGLAYGNIVTNSIMSIVLIIIFAREFEDTGGKEA